MVPADSPLNANARVPARVRSRIHLGRGYSLYAVNRGEVPDR
jgi:hypothetical protein